MPPPRVTVAPSPAPFAVEAVRAGGGTLVNLTDNPEALVWLDSHDVGGLTEAFAAAPGVRWVQLPSAGVESMTEVIDSTRIWTCAKGAYAQPVAEHALTLTLGGLRLLPARIAARSWGAQGGTSLFGERVTILGGAGSPGHSLSCSPHSRSRPLWSIAPETRCPALPTLWRSRSSTAR